MSSTKKNKSFRKRISSYYFIPFIILLIIVWGSGSYFSGSFQKYYLNSSTTPAISQTPKIIEPDISGEEKQDADLAKQALAAELNVPVNEISIKSVTRHEFNDTSLGCPQKNIFYSQVITPGFIVLLEYKGTVYPFHTASKRVIHCK